MVRVTLKSYVCVCARRACMGVGMCVRVRVRARRACMGVGMCVRACVKH